MLYFVQTAIPKKKHLIKGLAAIYGVGQPTSCNLVGSIGLLDETRGSHLRQNHLRRLKALLNDYPRLLGAELENEKKTKVQRLIDIDSYRGRRHKLGFPVRGQRTHTNAKTQKKLYRRWLINPYEKSKTSFLPKKTPQQQLKAKAKKGEKPKKKPSQPKAAAKTGKYKI